MRKNHKSGQNSGGLFSRTGRRIRNSFASKNFRHGSFTTILCVVVIAIAVILNLIMSSLSTDITNIDLSGNQLYSIGSTTEKLLKNLDQDVTIYPLYQNDDEDDTMMQLLKKYKAASDHIKVKVIDPVANPSFTSQYNADSLQNGSLIVVSEDRYKTIDYSEIYETDYSYDNYSSYTTETNFDGEGEITSAIDYVTSEDLPTVYYTTGHDEFDLTSSMTDALSKGNYDVEALSLLSEGQVPEDCGVLIINAPQSDFSADEAVMVTDYLEAGGHVLINASYQANDMTNFNSILADYGMSLTEGYILEGNSAAYYSTPMAILPSFGDHDITSEIAESSTPAIIYQPVGIEENDTRSSVTRTGLLYTTSEAYEKIPVDGQIDSEEKEKGDQEGSFCLGMIAEEECSDGSTAELVVYATPYLVEDSLVTSYQISNADLFINAISYMCGHESSVAIDTKSMTTETITPNAASVLMQVFLFVIFLPGTLVILGIAVWMKRRKK